MPDPKLPNPNDIHDIVTHKPYSWIFDGSPSNIQYHSKGKWGEIRFDVGLLYGAFFIGPFWIVLFVLLTG